MNHTSECLCQECYHGRMAELAPRAVLGVKLDTAKDPWHLLPTRALRAAVRVLAYGARKYAPDNWRHVPDAFDRYYSALWRHMSARKEGELLDAESGHPHLAHAACCVLFLLELEGRA